MLHEVDFNNAGFAILEVSIKPKTSLTMVNVDYKVDSGANCTTISSKRLFDLGYDEEWIRSGKLLTGSEAPTVASGIAVDDCYEVIL